MAQIVWTEPAVSDLEEIAEYVALSNPTAARKLVQRVFAGVGKLKSHPRSGRIPEEIREFAYREVVVSPCRIFYRYQKDTVHVLHVVRQERDVRRYILESQS